MKEFATTANIVLNALTGIAKMLKTVRNLNFAQHAKVYKKERNKIMMPKQLPDMSQDIMTKKNAAIYAAAVMKKLKAVDIEQAISTAYLIGAKSGFCTGYRCSDIEAKKEYGEIIRELKRQVNKIN